MEMKYLIKEQECGYLMKNGRFVRLLTAGKYRFMKELGYEVQVVPMTGQVKTCGIPEEILMGDREFAARVVKAEVPDTCLAIRFVNQAFKEVLTGPEALFWNVFEKNTFQMVDMTEPCMEKVLPRMYIDLMPMKYYKKIVVKDGEVGLLSFDNRLERRLETGSYYFWNYGREVTGKIFNMKIQQLDITGQEILTADKVGVRLNVVCSYRITDPERLVKMVDGASGQLYTCAQLVLREYVGRFRLDELLAQKEEIGQYVLQKLRERLEETKKRYALKEDEYTRAGNEFAAAERELGTIEADLRNQKAQHAEAEYGFTPNQAEDERIAERLKGRSLNGYRAEAARALESAKSDVENYTGERQAARMKFNLAYSACGLTGTEESNKPYEDLYERYSRQYVEEYKEEFERKCREVYRSLRDNVIATIHGDIKAAYRQVREVNRVLGATAFSDSVYKIGITPASNENNQFYEMLTAPELDSKVVNEDDVERQISFGDDVFERKYEREISLLVEKFIPDRTGDERESAKKRAEMEKFADYRNYLTFNMYEVTVDESGQEKRIPVDEMAGNDSGGEGQNPKYVALFAGFALLFAHQNHRDSRIKIVLLDEAFSKMDKTRSSVCLNYARKLGLQVIICVPD